MVMVNGGRQGVPLVKKTGFGGDQGDDVLVPNPSSNFTSNSKLLQESRCKIYLKTFVKLSDVI